VLVIGAGARRAAPTRRLAVPLALLALAFYAVPDALFFGQPSVLGLLAVARAREAFVRGRDVRAGLWTGVLLVKPQYAAFLVLVLLWKRRWRAVGGVAAAGLLLLGSSLLLLGPEGVAAYAGAVLDLARFRVAEPLIAPGLMISWRGVLLNLLPPTVPDGLSLALSLIASAATALALWPVWRGPWAADGPRFDRQLLATMLVTMLASFHNHAHGATLLVAPALAVLAGRAAGPSLGVLMFLAVLVPNAVFFATLNGVWVAGSLVGLMAAALAVLLAGELRPAAGRAPRAVTGAAAGPRGGQGTRQDAGRQGP
jgi:glycosyl transferase family 87